MSTMRMNLLEATSKADPSSDLIALKQLFDHGWLSESEHQRLRQYIQDTCFGPNTPYYAQLQAKQQQAAQQTTKEANGDGSVKKIYHRKRGPRGPQRCSVCHMYRKNHNCDNQPCTSVETCGIERLHRYESFDENGTGEGGAGGEGVKRKRDSPSGSEEESEEEEEEPETKTQERPPKRIKFEIRSANNPNLASTVAPSPGRLTTADGQEIAAGTAGLIPLHMAIPASIQSLMDPPLAAGAGSLLSPPRVALARSLLNTPGNNSTNEAEELVDSALLNLSPRTAAAAATITMLSPARTPARTPGRSGVTMIGSTPSRGVNRRILGQDHEDFTPQMSTPMTTRLNNTVSTNTEASDNEDSEDESDRSRKQQEIQAALHVFSQNVKVPCPATYNDNEVIVTSKAVQGNNLIFVLDNGLSVDAFRVSPVGNSLEAKFNRKLLVDYKQWVMFVRDT